MTDSPCDACCVCKHEGNYIKANCFVLYSPCLEILNRQARQCSTNLQPSWLSDGIEKFLLFWYDECPLFLNTQVILFFYSAVWIISQSHQQLCILTWSMDRINRWLFLFCSFFTSSTHSLWPSSFCPGLKKKSLEHYQTKALMSLPFMSDHG